MSYVFRFKVNGSGPVRWPGRKKSAVGLFGKFRVGFPAQETLLQLILACAAPGSNLCSTDFLKLKYGLQLKHTGKVHASGTNT